MNFLTLKGLPQKPLRVERAGRFPMGPGSVGTIYSHSTTALHLHNYSGQVHIGRHCFELKPGDVTLTPPETPSRYTIHQPGTHLCIHFFPGKHQAPSSGTLRLPLHFRASGQSAFLADGFARVAGFHRRSGHAGKSGVLAAAAAAASLHELLLTLALAGGKTVTTRQGNSEVALKKLTSLIDERFAEPWTASAMAGACGLSQDYIAVLFRKHYGTSISRALLLRRMDVARHLLQSSNLSVKAVGAAVGIPDAQYFNKQFRRLNGLSPSAFLLSRTSS